MLLNLPTMLLKTHHKHTLNQTTNTKPNTSK